MRRRRNQLPHTMQDVSQEERRQRGQTGAGRRGTRRSERTAPGVNAPPGRPCRASVTQNAVHEKASRQSAHSCKPERSTLTSVAMMILFCSGHRRCTARKLIIVARLLPLALRPTVGSEGPDLPVGPRLKALDDIAVSNDGIVGEGINAVIKNHDATAYGEVEALTGPIHFEEPHSCKPVKSSAWNRPPPGAHLSSTF